MISVKPVLSLCNDPDTIKGPSKKWFEKWVWNDHICQSKINLTYFGNAKVLVMMIPKSYDKVFGLKVWL